MPQIFTEVFLPLSTESTNESKRGTKFAGLLFNPRGLQYI